MPAADNFLPERDPGSACRHGPSRATAAMGCHERFRSELAAGFEAQKKKCQPGRRRAFECLDRKQDASLVEYGHSHGELHRAIKGREEAFSAASAEEKALAREPAPEAPRIPSSSSVAFFLKLFSSCCTCPASYSAISCIRLTADHSSHRSPRLRLAPGCPLDRMHATASGGPPHFVIPKRAKRKGKMAGQR